MSRTLKWSFALLAAVSVGLAISTFSSNVNAQQTCSGGSCQGASVRQTDPPTASNSGGLPLSGDVSTSGSVATLTASGVTAATYGSTSTIPQVAVDVKGRITSASSLTPALPGSAITSGPITQAVGGTGRNSAVTCAAGDFLTSNGSTYSCATPSGVVPGGAASGDLGSNYPSPTVLATHLSAALPEAQGGTGAGALTCAAGQHLTSNGTVYSCSTDTGGAATLSSQQSQGATSGSCATTGTNITSITISTTGTYLIIGTTSLTPAVGDTVNLLLTKAGVGLTGAQTASDNGAALGASSFPATVATIAAFNATQVLALQCAASASTGAWSQFSLVAIKIA